MKVQYAKFLQFERSSNMYIDNETDTETLLTVEQVCEVLKTSKNIVYKLCSQGELPAFRLPHTRRWLFPAQEINKYILSCGKYNTKNC